MRGINPTDRRAMVSATCLLVLGTAVRMALAPGASPLAWTPAGSDRASETLSEARNSVDQALEREAEANRPLEAGERIDINTADASTLRRLPGVGSRRAAAIISDRTDRGPYRAAEDLSRIPGIGSALVGRIRPHIRPDSRDIRRIGPYSMDRLDLNRAQINELEQITGIGPALAARIVAARALKGRFEVLADLLAIPGIGPKTLEILQAEAYVP